MESTVNEDSKIISFEANGIVYQLFATEEKETLLNLTTNKQVHFKNPSSIKLLILLVKENGQRIKNEVIKEKIGLAENSLHKAVVELRKALNDENDKSIIRTYHHQGYAFEGKIIKGKEESNSEQPNIIVKEEVYSPNKPNDSLLKDKKDPQRFYKILAALGSVIVLILIFFTVYFFRNEFSENKIESANANSNKTNLANSNSVNVVSSPTPKPTPCLTVSVENGKVSADKGMVSISGKVPEKSIPWVFVMSLIGGSDYTWWANPTNSSNSENSEWTSYSNFGKKVEQGEFKVIAVAVSEQENTNLNKWYNDKNQEGIKIYPSPIQGCISKEITVIKEIPPKKKTEKGVN